MQVLKNTVQDDTALSLAALFERFTESGQKLEVRYAGLMREVEDLKAQLSRKEEEVKRSERLAMLGETAAALAHEIRNPLGAITIFLSMLKGDVADRPEALAMAEEIERSIASLNNVVSNVLHFAKSNTPRQVPFNVHSVIHETAQHFANLYNQTASITATTTGNPFILGDDQGLRQALYNLVVNALQAAEFKGTISLLCKDNPHGEGVVITVADSGPGIPERLMERLFEPFVSGKASGTGLGLSIVRRIVEGHGGDISVKNDDGAVFVIQLPRKPLVRARVEHAQI